MVAKATWEKTPFESLEQARTMAKRMGLSPGEIQTKGSLRFFQWSEGRKVSTMAQAIAGGPVKERTEKKAKVYRAPKPKVLFREWVVGKWIRVDHESLAAAEASHLGVYLNPDNVEVVRVIMFRDKDTETEYAQDSHGVWTRVISRSPLRGPEYRKSVEAREDKAREDGTLR